MNDEERTIYAKRLEALEYAFKAKAIEPSINLVEEASFIYLWLNPTQDDE